MRPNAFVILDLPNPRGAGLFSLGCVAWLAVRALLFGLGGVLGQFDVIAAAAPVAFLVVLVAGPRRIEVGEDGIRVYRRGRLRLERRLEDVEGFRGPALFTRLVFRDGTWVLWFPYGPDWGPPTAWIAARVGATARTGTLTAHAGALVWPRRCVGCGGAPEVIASVTARRGLSLGLWGFFVRRDLAVPCCRACRRRQWAWWTAWSFGGIVAFVVVLFLPLLTPLKGTPVAVLAGLSAAAFLYGANRGDERADWQALGVWARLAPDATTVHLDFRRADLAAEVERASIGRAEAEPASPHPA